MAELTRIITVEITGIQEGNVENILPKEKVKARLQDILSDYLEADHVAVINIQDFIREEGDSDEQSAATNEES